jgi:transposase
LYLGLDIDAKGASWCIWHPTDGSIATGRSRDLLSILTDYDIKAVAMEYTGKLAEKWISELDKPTYIIHTVDRSSLTRLARQTNKTDRKDAETIARYLCIWLEQSSHLALPRNLFTPAEQIKHAWKLRAYLAAEASIQSMRLQAQNRADAAHRALQADIAAIWEHLAKTLELEQQQAMKRTTDYATCHYSKELEALIQIPGVGQKIAVRAIATLCPIQRFGEGKGGIKRAVAYVGLHPRNTDSAGEPVSRPQLPRRGNKALRTMLYAATMSAMKESSPYYPIYTHHKAKSKHTYSVRCIIAHAILRRIIATLQQTGETQ